MSNNIAIKVENLSKAYQLGDIGTGTISRDLERWYARLRGKEDPFLKIGETNDRSTKGSSDIVWSLKDINFEIEQGDAVGIIGRNGAGKSTLLKILSKVTAPTTGRISGKGRIASLLEVGTGFHPELSGRENIFLNGAILGMRKKEIQRKLDEIVDFAGIERYLDTPVKRYSSGMYVRLAFAVAAHLESEILIVDEVLAVGDAEFQKKCIGKMGEVSKGEGRTVLFVSHNMASVQKLCNKGLFLKNGITDYKGIIQHTIDKYIASGEKNNFFQSDDESSLFRSVNLYDDRKKVNSRYLTNENIFVQIQIYLKEKINNLTLSIVIKDSQESPITSSHHQLAENQLGLYEFTAMIPKNFLLSGGYKLDPILHIPKIKFIQKLPFEINFQIEDSGSPHLLYKGDGLGQISLPITWNSELII